MPGNKETKARGPSLARVALSLSVLAIVAGVGALPALVASAPSASAETCKGYLPLVKGVEVYCEGDHCKSGAYSCEAWDDPY